MRAVEYLKTATMYARHACTVRRYGCPRLCVKSGSSSECIPSCLGAATKTSAQRCARSVGNPFHLICRLAWRDDYGRRLRDQRYDRVEHLVGRHRLREVVVGASAECVEAVEVPSAGGQGEDGRSTTVLSCETANGANQADPTPGPDSMNSRSASPAVAATRTSAPHSKSSVPRISCASRLASATRIRTFASLPATPRPPDALTNCRASSRAPRPGSRSLPAFSPTLAAVEGYGPRTDTRNPSSCPDQVADGDLQVLVAATLREGARKAGSRPVIRGSRGEDQEPHILQNTSTDMVAPGI